MSDSVKACVEDLNKKTRYAKDLGINIVPVTNPAVVPRSILRQVEVETPLVCSKACTGPQVGQCKAESGDGALCTPPAQVHEVQWYNPAVSGKGYSHAVQALAGEYIEWKWDDVLHDLWLLPDADAAASCNFSAATQLFTAVHHSYEVPTGAQVDGRVLFLVPESAKGSSIYFACAVKMHCKEGQLLEVAVGPASAVPDSGAFTGVCPVDFELCPDDSLQVTVGQRVKTDEPNVPWTHPRASESLLMEVEAASVTRASTPWVMWQTRRFDSMVCPFRSNNEKNFGVDLRGAAAWEFKDSTLREVVEACSSNHPHNCMGIAWKKGSKADGEMYSGRHTSDAAW